MANTNSRIVTRAARPLSQAPRGAYGLWEAQVKTADGRTFWGGGLNEQQALHRAEFNALVNGGAA